jgi:Protein of unknown function (DUF2752)
MEAPPLINPAPRRPWWRWTVALPVAMVALAVFLFDPSHYGFYPRCVLYATTGIYCPGCGATRAVYQLLHGHLVMAMHDNLLLVLALPFFAIFGLRWLWCWQMGAPLPRFTLSPRVIAMVVVLMTVFAILRNIRCEPFTWLAPVG